jgi:predicted DNA-binding protein YlxM (UPF0122 family)
MYYDNYKKGAYEIPSGALSLYLWKKYELPKIQREAQLARQAVKDSLRGMEGQ